MELQEWQRLSYSMGATGVCMSELAALPKGLLAAHRAVGAGPAVELDRSGSPAVQPSRGALLGAGALQTVDRCAFKGSGLDGSPACVAAHVCSKRLSPGNPHDCTPAQGVLSAT